MGLVTMQAHSPSTTIGEMSAAFSREIHGLSHARRCGTDMKSYIYEILLELSSPQESTN